MTELAAPQISSLMEALPGIAAVLRSPVANAIVALSRAAAGLEEFDAAHAEELLRFGVRRNLLTQDEIDSVLEELRVVVASRPKKIEPVVEKAKKVPPKPAISAASAVAAKPIEAPRPSAPVATAAKAVAAPAKPPAPSAKKAEVAKPAPKPPPPAPKAAVKAPAKAPAKAVPAKAAKAPVAAKSAPKLPAKPAAKAVAKAPAKAPAKAAPAKAAPAKKKR